MSSDDPKKKVDHQIEVTGLVGNNEFIEAVNVTLKLKKLIQKKPFQDTLFGEKMVFLNALRQAVAHKKELWLSQFLPDDKPSLSEQVPNWFTKIKGHPDWCQLARQSLLKAKILCAKEAIDYPAVNQEGWKKLADKTGFPVGFVYELFFWLKEQEQTPVDQREIPVLLEKGYGEKGESAYLVIERLELGIPSPPYPHPINMANIPVSEDFQKAVERAFVYVKSELLKSRDCEEKDIPVFRWWLKKAPNEKAIFALEGPSFYGAFAAGMLILARQLNLYPKTAITSDGDKYGRISSIGGLTQKCQAANRQSWKIIIANQQNTQLGDNDISDIQIPLLRAKTIEEAIRYLTSGIGFESLDYLELVYKRWGQLLLTEVPQKTPDAQVDEIDFDKITKPMTVRYIKGLNKKTEEVHDWDKEFSNQPEKLRRCVIYGWEKVGKTRLLRHEGRKISQENADKLKQGKLDLEQVTIPIFLQCADLANQLKGETTFEDALIAALRDEYQINGQTLSDKFVVLIKDKFQKGNCVLLLDDFHSVNKKVRPKWVDKLNTFARNYRQCRIIITVQQSPKNNKDDYADLPLEIAAQSDEAILELMSPFSNDCPYKGLHFFDVNDAKYFYGREKLTQRLLKKVKDSNFLAVLGNSGSGKSSVVRAGLLHQLKLGEKLPGSEQWKIFPPITPAWQNQKPLENLARVFVPSDLSEIDYANYFIKVKKLLATGADGLKQLINAIDADRVVLVIDQFEEIFTRCDKIERQNFFDCLLGALAHHKLCLVIVIRADFHGKWAEYAELSGKIDDNSVTVSKMTLDELEQAITEPAKKIGLGIEQDLVRQILKDMENSPSNLPLLQFSLERLWHNNNVNWLTLAEYNQIGGVEGALKNHADKVYQSLSPEEQETAQWIFQGVTQLGEGVEDTRKQIAKPDLITAKYPEALIDKTLDKLIKARLVVSSNPSWADKETHESSMNP